MDFEGGQEGLEWDQKKIESGAANGPQRHESD